MWTVVSFGVDGQLVLALAAVIEVVVGAGVDDVVGAFGDAPGAVANHDEADELGVPAGAAGAELDAVVELLAGAGVRVLERSRGQEIGKFEVGRLQR